MKVVKKISLSELTEMAERMYGGLVKADVDLAKGIVIVDMEMHADGEAELLDSGSKQEDLWGINLYPDKFGSNEFIEFDSMINLRPKQNRSITIVNETIKKRIREIIAEVVHE